MTARLEVLIDTLPRTEVQELADLCHVWLLLDSARLYGLVCGGPKVNVARCEQILAAAKARGVVPRTDAVDRCLPGIMAGEIR